MDELTLPPELPDSPKGVAVIEAAMETMPANPGVYRMLDHKGDALYVGKARSLKRRVLSYTQIGRLPERLRRMVSDTVSMAFFMTLKCLRLSEIFMLRSFRASRLWPI